MEKRNRHIDIRVSDDEHSKLTANARAAGLSVSDYMRLSGLVLAIVQPPRDSPTDALGNALPALTG